MKRTMMCGELTKAQVGQRVTLMGWVAKQRDLGGISFVDLRDRSGIIQIVCNDDAPRMGREYVISVEGEVRERSADTVNSGIATGEIEVKADKVSVLAQSETPPFEIEEDSETNEQVRLKYRYLDLRRPNMQRNLVTRHKIAKIVRDYLDGHGFLEIETPMLTKSTPEGARDYLVPSRVHAGAFYALPQSPQLYKQICMISGIDRYFQIVRCFRDEDLRADRQPEFTQIDVEMSFVDIEDIIEVNEGLISEIMSGILGINIKLPLARMSYAEAMERFGSDKPDTRFGMELTNLSEVVKSSEFKVFSGAIESGGSVRAINAKGAASKLSRRDLDGLVEFVKIYRAKGLAWIVVEQDELKSPITKFLSKAEIDGILSQTKAEVGDVILFVADSDDIVFDSMGNLRLELARRLDLIDDSKFEFLWVTDFPLLEYDSDEKRYTAKHHPFTAPMDEDIPLMESAPEKVRAKAYDIILNGNEIGGGSLRIHDTALQERMFKLLGFSEKEAWERFGFLLEAFKYGTPPHGGIAYGLDRVVMLLTKSESIREVIAFPKVQTAAELMSGAPDFVDKKQLKELHIKCTDAEGTRENSRD
ncbi:MAG: aspartate--tRNA ligase [Clostridiales bacterium]|jgi:aspartyl-tRNA synthetase|nr:aspartate--tRNA ligase [Clostridiales bacterium]